MSRSHFYPPSAEIAINAPIDRVWSVLLDGEAYPEWGRFIRAVEGALDREHARVRLMTRLGRSTVRPFMRVLVVEPPDYDGGSAGKVARWEHKHDGKFARMGLISSHRVHEFTQEADSNLTVYKTHETFSGILRPFMPFKLIDEGFKQQALDLKAHCERAG